MSFNYIEFKEKENLNPFELVNKEELYHALMNVEHSWTGRVDALRIANTFMNEAAQLIINAITLFEKGYFDCAYYSLRQSLEVSTTMIYLTDLDNKKKEHELQKWKSQSEFPMYGQMINFLDKNSDVFSDIKKKMHDYFDELKKINKKLNKYVHKQGFRTFYVSRNHFLNIDKDSSDFINEFLFYAKVCIGAIAVNRLAIDPFPILLMDEEIFKRTGDTMTEAYTDEFVANYIGNHHIDNYKKTEIYINHYEEILQEEAKLPSVVNIIKHQYIDREKIDEIMSQKHLLSKLDILAVIITVFFDKVAKIYTSHFMPFYHTNVNSLRKSLSFNSSDLHKIKESQVFLNNKYDEAYLSYIEIGGEEIFIEHNDILDKREINELLILVEKSINK